MKKRNLAVYLLSLLPVAAVAALGGWVTRLGMADYQLLEKPALTPPAIVFPIVWTILYLLMAVGSARIYLSGSPRRDAALAVYALQLAVNLSWSFLFFGLQAYLFSFLWLVLLIGLVVAMIALFYRIDRPAALMQLPYLLWLLLAGYLNLSVYLLNR